MSERTNLDERHGFKSAGGFLKACYKAQEQGVLDARLKKVIDADDVAFTESEFRQVQELAKRLTKAATINKLIDRFPVTAE